jgi:hypothetical protein
MEWSDHSSTTPERIRILNKIGEKFKGARVTYVGDPKVIDRHDAPKVSPIKEFRKLHLPIKSRKKIDRNSLDAITTLLRNPEGMLIQESECPLLIRALRKASHKVNKGVKIAALDNTGEEYPLYALRVALDDALRKVKVTSY